MIILCYFTCVFCWLKTNWFFDSGFEISQGNQRVFLITQPSIDHGLQLHLSTGLEFGRPSSTGPSIAPLFHIQQSSSRIFHATWQAVIDWHLAFYLSPVCCPRHICHRHLLNSYHVIGKQNEAAVCNIYLLYVCISVLEESWHCDKHLLKTSGHRETSQHAHEIDSRALWHSSSALCGKNRTVVNRVAPIPFLVFYPSFHLFSNIYLSFRCLTSFHLIVLTSFLFHPYFFTTYLFPPLCYCCLPPLTLNPMFVYVYFFFIYLFFYLSISSATKLV